MKKRLVLTLLAALLLALAPGRAAAAFLLTVTQVGPNVVVTGSGTLNTTALTQLTSSGGTVNTFGLIRPYKGALISGPASLQSVNVYSGGGFTGPATFSASGQAITTFANSGSGDMVGLNETGTNRLIAPLNYVSGTALTTTSTYNNATFASLDLAPGVYTYTWGTGASADSLTIRAIPEPSVWALLTVGVAGLGVVTLRRRGVARA